MVIDAFLAPILALVRSMVDRLPTGQALNIGPVDAFWHAVRQFDSLVPVMGPINAALTLLGVVVGFVIVRLILTVWNLIYP